MNYSELSSQSPHPESRAEQQLRLENLLWGSIETGGLSRLLFENLSALAENIARVSIDEKEQFIRRLIACSKDTLLFNLHRGLLPSWEIIQFLDDRGSGQQEVIDKMELLILDVFKTKIQADQPKMQSILENYFHQQHSLAVAKKWVEDTENNQHEPHPEMISRAIAIIKEILTPTTQNSLSPFLVHMQISSREIKHDDTLEKYRRSRQRLMQILAEGHHQSHSSIRLESTLNLIHSEISQWVMATNTFPELAHFDTHSFETARQLATVISQSALHDEGIVKKVFDFAQDHQLWETLVERIGEESDPVLDRSVQTHIVELQIACIEFLRRSKTEVLADVIASLHVEKRAKNVRGAHTSHELGKNARLN